MTDLPPPTKDPAGFLSAALAQGADGAALRLMAEAAGCRVHDLGALDAAALAERAALHAAGARALAASIARGAAPMLLIAATGAEGVRYQGALTEGLMGYERIHVDVSAPSQPHGLALILILPPVEVNRYWGP